MSCRLKPFSTRSLITSFAVDSSLKTPTMVSLVLIAFSFVMVTRIDRLLNVAEYKRRQAAPGVKVTEKNFGRDRRVHSPTPPGAARAGREAGRARRPRVGGSVRGIKRLSRRGMKVGPTVRTFSLSAAVAAVSAGAAVAAGAAAVP